MTTSDCDPDLLRKMKALSRQYLREIWQAAQSGLPMEGENARLVKVMRQYPAYLDLWDHLDRLTDEEIERDGVNPVLHIEFHLVIENQIADQNPMEVDQVVQVLVRKGHARHDAIHAVADVLIREIVHMQREDRVFDQQRYVRKLRELL
jgi:hypothetical protein